MPPPLPAIATPIERNRWVVNQRGPRLPIDRHRPVRVLEETEPDGSGGHLKTLTIFLANSECPWKCVMCDLWKETLESPVPPGAIPAQMDLTLKSQPHASSGPWDQIKLYNAGSFFDARAIPPEDHPAIAERLDSCRRTVVESHPQLIGDRVIAFRDRLRGELEVAMGLETIDPMILERLNKGVTLDTFSRAARFLVGHAIRWRAFVLLQPPFCDPAQSVDLTVRSVEFAWNHGASVVSIIPTRSGNGAMETLAAQGHFTPPTLTQLETAHERCLQVQRGLVFVDTWDLETFSECAPCFAARKQRLETMNARQQTLPRIPCDCSPASSQ